MCPPSKKPRPEGPTYGLMRSGGYRLVNISRSSRHFDNCHASGSFLKQGPNRIIPIRAYILEARRNAAGPNF